MGIDATTYKHQAVLLFGPPGAGKGTQGRVLGTLPGFFYLDLGAAFRDLDRASELGRMVAAYTDHGELVPDELAFNVWRKRLRQEEEVGRYHRGEDLLLLDGMPRTREEACMLNEQADVLKVLHLVSRDEEKLKQRLRRRAQEENREDDAREEILEHRFAIYREQTAGLVDLYPDERVADIDALAAPLHVLGQIVNALLADPSLGRWTGRQE